MSQISHGFNFEHILKQFVLKGLFILLKKTNTEHLENNTVRIKPNDV